MSEEIWRDIPNYEGYIKPKYKFLGSFKNEIDAANAYQKAALSINSKTQLIEKL